MDLKRELDLYLRSRHTLLCIVSFEEARIQEEIKQLCESTKRTMYVWDMADGFQILCGEGSSVPTAIEPVVALKAIEQMSGSVLILLRDFHQAWESDPRVLRKLRSLSHALKYTRTTLVVTMPTLQIPEELKDEAVTLDIPPPSLEHLDGILTDLLRTPGVKVDLTKESRSRLVRAALGLSSNQAQRIFSKAIVSGGILREDDIHVINTEKKLIIRQSGALEFFAPTETVGDVGGLGALKSWLQMREAAFSEKARKYGLPAPKGIALIGIPGTGKSLTAKVVAGLWRLPLIRLDVGALFGSFVGQSEANMRMALSLAETISPCLLWIDEIEKGLATSQADGGTSSRVVGTLLSWMQEKRKPVFMIATANNISQLPPELLRRGRFDEIFFLDLPTEKERREIFEVHIGKRGRDISNYDIDLLANLSEGYVGAEIEQAVIDGMYHAFNDESAPAREFTTQDILHGLQTLIPMSRSQHEQISALRLWVEEGRAQTASLPDS